MEALHCCHNSGGSPIYPSPLQRKHEGPASSKELRFRLQSRDEGSFPASSGKNSRRFDASQEEARCTGKARGTHGSWHHSKCPQMSPSIPEDPVFPALLRLSCRGSTHTTVARVTTLWESLVGKPRGKATDPLIHATGSVTLLLQHGRKAHVHAPTRDEN